MKNDLELGSPKVKTCGVFSSLEYSICFFGVIQVVNKKLSTDNIILKSDENKFFYQN